MGSLLAVVVVMADTALVAAMGPGVLLSWGTAGYALAAGLVIVLCRRSPAGAFVAALTLASLAGGTYLLLLWTAYHAGRGITSPRSLAVAVGAALGGLAARLVVLPPPGEEILPSAYAYLVIVALPLLVGRYLAQHERLVSTLDRHNRRLRQERELLAERERLRERLRIARDMHDSLGHRLSLVSVQAAALEVSPLPAPERQAVQQLAGAARAAMDELYELVGALRAQDEPPVRSFGAQTLGTLLEEFRAAGVTVELRWRGEPRVVSPAAGEAVYRVVEEGLTNTVKHAPGLPVTVNIAWEPDALLITVSNPVPDHPVSVSSTGSVSSGGSGHGLAGLGERVRLAGGFLDHRRSAEGFRLFAMVPAADGETTGGEVSAEASGDGPSGAERLRTVALGLAAAVAMIGILSAGVVVGVR
ncbi:hypothetical protein GCM10010156_20210 [Planobispora rosea]|uniref:histidine kinase n=1 Tax=Planobispora rosea TaxID=35762 RepID=A0A8J3WEL3_PLARO|nr:histidine kinase [Planobispora rosea]GGS61540.1 hypothetical protein GCM10010156_20210 [Planobispora rosea]GIH86525.1 hypothetical protein Pro02_49330 [Planobispora rosea]